MKFLKKNFKGKLLSDEKILHVYNSDATVISTGKLYPPELVIFPESIEDIVKIIKHCRTRKIPLFFRGGGTGMTGGASISRPKSVMISSEKLIKISPPNFQDNLIQVEAGVIPDDLNNYLCKTGYFYPPAPASSGISTIGGNISENSNGLNVFKYGTTGDWVRGLTFITGSGEVLRVGGIYKKSVAGYALKDLIIGSEGTLGFIFDAKLSIIRIPEALWGISLFFDSIKEGLKFVRLIHETGYKPAIFEFIDTFSLKASELYKKINIPKETKALVILKFEGLKPEIKYLEILIKNFIKNFDIFCHSNTNTEEGFSELMDMRKGISPALFNIARGKINEDLVIPISQLEDFFKFIHKVQRRFKLKIAVFGHIGYGNLHTNIMYDPGSAIDMKNLQNLLDELIDFVINIGGSITGEHGVGLTKKKYLKKELGGVNLKISKEIKKIFDPDNIINPGKIF
ncbi:FAD-binding protein [Candidatus Dependentiae bacterium]|nr:FAD-binding protein [Candidatus Dependentiae bacterium]